MKNPATTASRLLRAGRRTLSAAALMSLATLACAAGDEPGSKDHPLLTRFAGATINGYSQTAFDEAFLPNQPVDDEKTAKGLNLEGKVTRIASATGINSLPSSPCSVSSGRNTMTMMPMPEVTGTTTSRNA